MLKINKNFSRQFKGIKFGSQGITLMETIVAIGILILGIVSALTLMVRTLNFSQSSEQSVVVVNLAREGIEMVRSIRSTDGFAALNTGSKIIDVEGSLSLEDAHFIGDQKIENCINCSLYLYNGRYVHNDLGEITPFKRLIILADESSSEKKVISQVYWTEHNREHLFSLEDHLTDW